MDKVLYTIFFGNTGTGVGVSFSTTNLRQLSERSGLSYWRLVHVFIRKKLNYWVDRDTGYHIIRSRILYVGRGRGESVN